MSPSRRPALALVALLLLVPGCLGPPALPEDGLDPNAAPVTQRSEERIATAAGELRLIERALPSGSEPREVVLFLAPFGVPTAEAFDVPGVSWMEDTALAGFDAWSLDVRGFGASARPSAMDQPAMQNPPALRATEALADVDAAVDHVRAARNVSRVHVVGWSWGAVLAAMYAIEHPEKVDRLVLHGAMHGFTLESMTRPMEDAQGNLNPKLPAYQLANWSMTLHHWHMMDDGRGLARPDVIDAVARVFTASDPAPPAPGTIRRPMGPLVDLYYIWSDAPIFDAGAIRSPTLVIRGDLDFFADPGLLAELRHAPTKREVVIGDATHWAVYERNRDQLVDETLAFLIEPASA